MKIDKAKSVFLLGGHDLEMLTIKELLLKQGFKEGEHIFDKHLSWEEAVLSAYQEEIKAHTRKRIYAIELRYKKEDELYGEYQDEIEIIDHHNELSDNPTSLEQIIELLEIEDKLDSKTKSHYDLVAANDRDYIDGLKCIGATDAKIEWIRRKDREAQGVTKSDEKSAKNDVRSRKEKHGIVTICATTEKFGAITDELYFTTKPYNPSRCIVYNDKEIVFFKPPPISLSILIIAICKKGELTYV